jgi:hypothetical protein
MQRRDVLKVVAGAAVTTWTRGLVLAAPSKVRVTLVRWPYT